MTGEKKPSNTKQPQRQYLWIIRSGLTNAKDPYLDADIAYPGVEHARAVGERIRNSGDDTIPKVVYCSPFVRTVHTAQLIALKLRPHCRCVRVEEGLISWLIPSTPEKQRTTPKSLHELAGRYGTVDVSYKSVNPIIASDDDDNRNKTNNHKIIREGPRCFVEETEEHLIQRCGETLRRLLEVDEGENFAVVSHVPCNQAIAINLEGKAHSVEQSRLGSWPLGGITLFSRMVGDGTSYGEWDLEFYGNTDHMPGLYKPGIKRWSLPCLENNSNITKELLSSPFG